MPAASSREDTPADFQQTPPRSYHTSPSILSHTHHPSPPIQTSFITRCCSWQTKGTGGSPGFCHSTTTNSPALASLEKESKPACFSLQALQQVIWITGPYSSLSKTSITTGKWFLSMRLRGQAGTRGQGPKCRWPTAPCTWSFPDTQQRPLASMLSGAHVATTTEVMLSSLDRDRVAHSTYYLQQLFISL